MTFRLSIPDQIYNLVNNISEWKEEEVNIETYNIYKDALYEIFGIDGIVGIVYDYVKIIHKLIFSIGYREEFASGKPVNILLKKYRKNLHINFIVQHSLFKLIFCVKTVRNKQIVVNMYIDDIDFTILHSGFNKNIQNDLFGRSIGMKNLNTSYGSCENSCKINLLFDCIKYNQTIEKITDLCVFKSEFIQRISYKINKCVIKYDNIRNIRFFRLYSYNATDCIDNEDIQDMKYVSNIINNYNNFSNIIPKISKDRHLKHRIFKQVYFESEYEFLYDDCDDTEENEDLKNEYEQQRNKWKKYNLLKYNRGLDNPSENTGYGIHNTTDIHISSEEHFNNFRDICMFIHDELLTSFTKILHDADAIKDYTKKHFVDGLIGKKRKLNQ